MVYIIAKWLNDQYSSQQSMMCSGSGAPPLQHERISNYYLTTISLYGALLTNGVHGFRIFTSHLKPTNSWKQLEPWLTGTSYMSSVLYGPISDGCHKLRWGSLTYCVNWNHLVGLLLPYSIETKNNELISAGYAYSTFCLECWWNFIQYCLSVIIQTKCPWS